MRATHTSRALNHGRRARLVLVRIGKKGRGVDAVFDVVLGQGYLSKGLASPAAASTSHAVSTTPPTPAASASPRSARAPRGRPATMRRRERGCRRPRPSAELAADARELVRGGCRGERSWHRSRGDSASLTARRRPRIRRAAHARQRAAGLLSDSDWAPSA